MIIYRNALQKMVAWKEKSDRCPLLLKGARQIGKTWLMHEFGKTQFKHMLEINFDMQPEYADIFNRSKNPQKIIEELQLYSNEPIVEGETLLVFDEIQACESALNSLKYFAENMPNLHIVAAGSLLGVAVRHKHMSVPVGKVEILNLYPVTFDEFFHTENPKIWEWLDKNLSLSALPIPVTNALYEAYQQYMVCGGMPKAIITLLSTHSVQQVEEVLGDILSLYEADFSKYASATEIIRIGQIWRSLPSQLAKENRKFVYKVVRTGARAREYEDALLWLQDAGLVKLVYAVEKPSMPLSAYSHLDAFKVYALDYGLLRHLAHIPAGVVIGQTAGFVEMKGALAENFVLQSILPTLECEPYYWCSSGIAEVEFVTQVGTGIFPVEVKAGENLSGKSLKSYADKYQPAVMLRFAKADLFFKNGLLSIPLPLAYQYKKLLQLAIG